MIAAFFALLAFVAGVAFGWGWAHQTVAAECERLGGFFVGQKVYRCAPPVEKADK